MSRIAFLPGGQMRLWGLLLAVSSLLATQLGVAQSSPSQDQTNPHQQQEQSKDKKDRGDDGNSEVFSTAVANNVLKDIRDGLEGHTQRLMLSAFDADKMDGYLEFRDQIQALFNRYESFRTYFHIIQSATEGAKGVVLVDIQLEEVPHGGSPPVRKSSQMRFELEHGRKGWKIVDLNPRNFFS
jgi:hypothetical protein